MLLCQSAAHAKCADDWLEVDQFSVDDGIELRAVNQQKFPITYSVRIRENTAPSKRKTYRGSLKGGESRPLAVITADDDGNVINPRVSCSWTIGDDDASHDDDHLYRLPYADGTSYRVLQGFGSSFSHRGIEQTVRHIALVA